MPDNGHYGSSHVWACAWNDEKDYSVNRRLHSLSLHVMHWVNAITIFVMVGSGWKIHNDEGCAHIYQSHNT